MARDLRRMAAFLTPLSDVLPDFHWILNDDERRGLAQYLLTPADPDCQRFMERLRKTSHARAEGCLQEANIYEQREAPWAKQGRKDGGSRYSGQARDARRINADLCLLYEVVLAKLLACRGADATARIDVLLGAFDLKDASARAAIRRDLVPVFSDTRHRTDETRVLPFESLGEASRPRLSSGVTWQCTHRATQRT